MRLITTTFLLVFSLSVFSSENIEKEILKSIEKSCKPLGRGVEREKNSLIILKCVQNSSKFRNFFMARVFEDSEKPLVESQCKAELRKTAASNVKCDESSFLKKVARAHKNIKIEVTKEKYLLIKPSEYFGEGGERVSTISERLATSWPSRATTEPDTSKIDWLTQRACTGMIRGMTKALRARSGIKKPFVRKGGKYYYLSPNPSGHQVVQISFDRPITAFVADVPKENGLYVANFNDAKINIEKKEEEVSIVEIKGCGKDPTTIRATKVKTAKAAKMAMMLSSRLYEDLGGSFTVKDKRYFKLADVVTCKEGLEKGEIANYGRFVDSALSIASMYEGNNSTASRILGRKPSSAKPSDDLHFDITVRQR